MAQVVTYKNQPPGKMYCQLKLDSGERILVSIADSGIRISKLGFGGRFRTGTIWKCGRDEIREAYKLFEDPEKPIDSTLDAIKDRLSSFKSIADVKRFLSGKWG